MKKYKPLLALIAILLSAFIYIFYKPQITLKYKPVIFKGTAKTFNQVLAKDTFQWSGAIIQIKDVVTQSDSNSYMLGQNIFCLFEKSVELPASNKIDSIVVKGRFIGYDELLEEVKLDRCIVIKP